MIPLMICRRLSEATVSLRVQGMELRSIKNASTAAAGLRSAYASVTRSIKGLGVIKNTDLLSIKDRLVLSAKRFNSLSDAVRNKRVNAQSYRHTLAQTIQKLKEMEREIESVMQYLDAAGPAPVDEETGQAKSDMDHQGREATARSVMLMSQYTKNFAASVPKEIASLAVSRMPVLVRFGSPRITVPRLRDLGFKDEAMSSATVGGTDLGIVLEDQNILYFRATEAEKFNTGNYAVMENNQASGKIAISNLRKRIRSGQSAVKEIVAEARTLDRQRDRAKLIALTKQKRDIDDEIAGYERQIQKLAAPVKAGKQMVASIKRADSKTRDAAVMDYAEHLIATINERYDGSEFSLVTSMFMHRLGTDKDIVAMWIMDRANYVQLLNLSDASLNIRQWSWPWQTA